MTSRQLVVCMLFTAALACGVPTLASARQGGPLDAAGQSVPTPTPTPTPTAPAADSTQTSPPERPVRGPSVRERGGRRSRGASAASGALMITIIVGALGYYVVKRLRR